MMLDALLALAATSTTDWAATLRDAEPLPAGEASGIVVGTGYYGDVVLDGCHRIAGVAAWAHEQKLDAEDVDVETTTLDAAATARWYKEHE